MSEENRPKWAEPITYRVIYGDTDRAGVVYYANYLRFFEMGRTEWMRSMLHTPYSELEKSGVLFPVVEAHVRYKAPAGYDDLLEIRTGLSGSSKVSLTFCYEIKRDGKVLVTGTTKHASADTTGRLTRIPEKLANELNRLLRE